MYVNDSLLASGEPCRCGIAHSDAPVARSFLRTDAELTEEKRLAHEKAAVSELQRGGADAVSPGMVVLAWLAVGIPLAWGYTERYRASQNSSTGRLFLLRARSQKALAAVGLKIALHCGHV